MNSIKLMKPVVLMKSLEDMGEEQKKQAVRLLNNKDIMVVEQEGVSFIPESEKNHIKTFFYGSEAVCIYREMLGLPNVGIRFIDVNDIMKSVSDYTDLIDIIQFVRRVDMRNERFNRLCVLIAPNAILMNEHRMLRECVEFLQDNNWNGHPFVCGYDIEDDDGNTKYCEDVRASLYDIGYDLIAGKCTPAEKACSEQE